MPFARPISCPLLLEEKMRHRWASLARAARHCCELEQLSESALCKSTVRSTLRTASPAAPFAKLVVPISIAGLDYFGTSGIRGPSASQRFGSTCLL